MGIGERLFVNNCATCHGSDARGSKASRTGGQRLARRHRRRLHRSTIAEGRQGMMPRWLRRSARPRMSDVAQRCPRAEPAGQRAFDSIRARLGQEIFGACAACHGADGKGMQAMGAPNLTDKVWLHGWGEAAVIAMINNGKTRRHAAAASRLSRNRSRCSPPMSGACRTSGDKRPHLPRRGCESARQPFRFILG